MHQPCKGSLWFCCGVFCDICRDVFFRQSEVVADGRNLVGDEEGGRRFADHDGLQHAALFFLVIGPQVGRVGGCTRQRNGAVLGFGIGVCLAYEFDGLVVAGIIEGERRRSARDARIERLAEVGS